EPLHLPSPPGKAVGEHSPQRPDAPPVSGDEAAAGGDSQGLSDGGEGLFAAPVPEQRDLVPGDAAHRGLPGLGA
ncbi:unnamed protein product, partial [Effrenium voratum]